jgi:hypothetical protein
LRWSYVLAQDKPADGTVPDWWANFYFGGSAAGSDDPDGDGFSNFAEYIGGTDPTDPASHFQMSVNRSGSNLQINFSPSVAGRIYQLSTTTNLNSGLWSFLADVPSSTNLNGTFTITNTSGSRFYRISLRVQ